MLTANAVLEDILPTLWPLLKRRDTYYILAILILAVLVYARGVKLHADELALNSRPRVENHVRTVTVRGPVRVETRTVYKPGTTQVEYVDRVETSAPSTTTTEAARTVSPACTPAKPDAPRWRYAGVIADPFSTTKIVGARAGVTLWKMIDVGVSARYAPRTEGAVDVGVRF